MTQAALPQYSDFDTELEQVKRSRAQIDALRKQALLQGAPRGEMIGKIWTPPTLQEHLQPGIQQIAAYYGEKQAAEKEAGLAKAMQAQADQWAGARPQATQIEQAGPVEEGQGPLMSAPIQPTQQQNLAWAQQGQKNPLTRALAAQYGADVLIKEPEREEARAWRGEQAEAARALTREKMTEQFKLDREKLAEQARDAKEKSRQHGLDLAEKKSWHEKSLALEKKLNEMKMSVEPSPRAKERTKLEEQVNSVHAVDNIVNEARPLLKKATGSGIGAALDTAGGIFGIVVPGSEEAAQLKVVEGNLMKHQPKFKGTDSDRDTKLYQAAAAQIGDAKTPNGIRETAMKTVQRLARKDMEMTHRLAQNFNIGSGEHLPKIDIPDMPEPLPEEGAPTPQKSGGLPKASGRVSKGTITDATMPVAATAPVTSMPAMSSTDTGTNTAPPVTVALPPADVERANILMSEYRKGPKAPMTAEATAAATAADKRDIAKELARMGIDAETGGPLQRRAADKAPAAKVRTWNREKGAFE
jgi:hypothetical protein